MQLNKVTITGADDLINPSDLIKLSKEYPFVEWGILFSKSKQGSERYPSLNWIEEFLNQINEKNKVKISAHICGKYMRDILAGNNTLPLIVSKFPRLQFNFKYFDENVNEESFIDLLKTNYFENKEIIFQVRNDVNDNFFYMLEKLFYQSKVKISALLDQSGGTGKEIDPNFKVFRSIFNTYYGYAGGINPTNIGTIIRSINEKGFGNENIKYWLDMESGVRTDIYPTPLVAFIDKEKQKNFDKEYGEKHKRNIFDLEKVNACLLTAKNYILP